MRSSIGQLTGQLSKVTFAKVNRSVPDGSFIASLIVFPTTEHFSDAEFPRHIRSVAFLRLVDETIWMLAIQGKGWTDGQLMVAGETLSNVSANAYTKASVERLLRQELKIASVSLESPVLGFVDLRQWSVREAAYVMFKRLTDRRSGYSSSESNAGLRISTIEESLIDGLSDALDDFAEGLEPTALKISSANGQFNQRLYNYLVHSSYHRFRIQFAETFPSLLLTSVLAERGSLGAELRSIVDSGAPLIKGLAERWGVRPGVVRHLVGKSSGHVGVRWSRDAMGLAISLNALNPADLPGDADAWGEFNHMVAVGQRLFGRPIWQSTAVLEWLRECMNRCRRGKKTAPNGWLPNWGNVPGIERFRNALSASLKRESADSPSRSENKVAAAVVEAVDSLILRMAALDLAVLASKFDDELDVARRGSGAAKVVLGETMLPLFPGELVSGDRTRVVRPLTTRLQLKESWGRT